MVYINDRILLCGRSECVSLNKTLALCFVPSKKTRPKLSCLSVASRWLGSFPSTIPYHGSGPSTEVVVGPDNGLDQTSVINCDSITTIPATTLGRLIGYLLPTQEAVLAGAIRSAFDLE